MAKKVAIACQGGGMHAAFEVGVLTEILNNIEEQKNRHDIDANKRFELVGLSGTSAGALCALMVWYGLAPNNTRAGSAHEASALLNDFWDKFVACPGVESVLNFLTYTTFRTEEAEIPLFGLNAPIFSGSFDPRGAIYNTIAAWLPSLGVRQRYLDLNYLLEKACPDFDGIDWDNVTTRLLIGASEVVNGLETVFDSDVKKKRHAPEIYYWRQRLPLSLKGVAGAGTLPTFRQAELIGDRYYWDGLYSQNPPVREFLWEEVKEIPDELWILRINPQQWPEHWPEEPKTNAEIKDRQNELMGNLSLHKELDFILAVNKWAERYKDERFGKEHKPVIVRTIKIKQETVDKLRYSSKFNRSSTFMNQLRDEGGQVGRQWLADWPDKVGRYPKDAAYREIPTTGPPSFRGFLTP
jgi:NTE family protein